MQLLSLDGMWLECLRLLPQGLPHPNLHSQNLLRGVEWRVTCQALLETSQGGEFDGSLQLMNPTAPVSQGREEEMSCC